MLSNLNKTVMLAVGLFGGLVSAMSANSAAEQFAPGELSLKSSPLVSLYKQTGKPEKGPVRIRFEIDDSLATKVEWDEDFYKRHLILREVKKGFTGYMYQFENDLISPESQCDGRNSKAHVNVVLKVSDITTGYSNDDFMNFYQLKLDSSINYTVAEVAPIKAELGYIQFNEPRKGRLKLSHGAIKKLRKHGNRTAKLFVEGKLEALIALLHKGLKGSEAQINKTMALCHQVMGDDLAYAKVPDGQNTGGSTAQ